MSSQLLNQSVQEVDLSHRVDMFGFYDSLNPSLSRIRALADLLEVVFYSDRASLEEETIKHAAQAIRMEATDAQAVLTAWSYKRLDHNLESDDGVAIDE